MASFAGIRWDLNDSGKVSNNHKPLSKKGNKYLRYYFYQAASSAIRFDPVLKAYYGTKRRQGKSHKAAVILTARKLIRSIFFMLKNNVSYQPIELYQPTRKKLVIQKET
ncbi:hypothetical protein X275_09425 [Marinitoga sp. 1197]|nr:hypothetical protein X275_09425 [Marinitoga sp. 1197]